MWLSIVNKNRLVFFLAVLSFLFSGSVPTVFAWGDDGHRIVAEIAREHISPIISIKLRDNFNIESLVKIAPWADKVKKNRSQKPWHYTNIREGEWTYDRKRDCPHRQCVTEKIRDFANILRRANHSKKQRKEALAYLVHFVADIHQPLHLGNQADRGGNNIIVHHKGKQTNLHALWDNGLIIRKGKSLLQYAHQLKCAIVAADRLSPAGLPVEAWSNESRQLALQHAYAVTFSKGRELTAEYIRSSRLIVERQLCRAGMRLANLLNAIL